MAFQRVAQVGACCICIPLTFGVVVITLYHILAAVVGVQMAKSAYHGEELCDEDIGTYIPKSIKAVLCTWAIYKLLLGVTSIIFLLGMFCQSSFFLNLKVRVYIIEPLILIAVIGCCAFAYFTSKCDITREYPNLQRVRKHVRPIWYGVEALWTLILWPFGFLAVNSYALEVEDDED